MKDEFRKKSELKKTKVAVEYWVGTTILQIIGVLISSVSVFFWTNKVTLFISSVMVIFLVVDLIALSLMIKQYKEKR